MYIRNNTIYNYNDFVHYMSEIILSSTKSVEQVLQFDSKYFKADPNLFRYDINLLSNTLNPNFIIKKLYLILKIKEVNKINNTGRLLKLINQMVSISKHYIYVIYKQILI